MLRQFSINVLVVCISLLLTLVALEFLVRALGVTDANGQFTFLQFRLEAQDLPINELRGQIEGYLANKDIANVIYDENLGWTFRPNAIRQGGSFTLNGAGIRSQREYSLEPAADTVRIATFGDSFTAGDDVADEQTWSYVLERELLGLGIRAEVLNFGVGAYGMDQAFLRWQQIGRQFAPDIVIFGLQPENLKRNVNVFRQLLHRSGPAFSKPRFALLDQQLKLLNVPTLPPEQLLAVFEDFSNHPLAPYEFHYQSRFRATRWWSSSRLLSLVFESLRQGEEEPGIYEPGSEGGELGKAIVQAFADSVKAEGKEFFVVHLPLQSHLLRYFSNLPRPRPVYDFLLEYSRESYHYLAFEEHLQPDHTDDAYWSETKHYGPRIHALLGATAAEAIAKCIETGACSLPRFDDSPQFVIEETAASN